MFHKRLEIYKELMLGGFFQKVSCVDLLDLL
jgi:hypothetical protein